MKEEFYAVMSCNEGYNKMLESNFVDKNFHGICDSLETARSLVRNLIEDFKEETSVHEDFVMSNVSYKESTRGDNIILAEFDHDNEYIMCGSMTYYATKANILTERDM